MKLKNITLKGFRRFHRLTISDLPAAARLVVLTGPNGCGKSSLFDSFATWYGYHRNWHNFESTYHNKVGFNIPWNEAVTLAFHEQIPNGDERKKLFYIRSAYRNEADFSVSGIGNPSSVLDDDRRVKRLIENDIHVSGNYQRLVGYAVEQLFNSDNETTNVKEVRDRLIGQVRRSMLNVFDNLLLSGPGNPMVDGTFYFEKGQSKNFRYKNLSGGEKAVFDILLDFIVKTTEYNNTIFCIDEPELHINTRLQGKLLEEIFSLIPRNCQLWISTHSIGMMRTAMKLKDRARDEVIFLDFDNRDFDQECSITPQVPDRRFWSNALKIALDDLAGLVAPSHLILCEGRSLSPQTPERSAFDAHCYRTIFGAAHPHVDFVSVGSSNEVKTDHLKLGHSIQMLFPDTRITKLIDRDDLSNNEVSDCIANGIRVLSRRTIESYLFDDEILQKFCDSIESSDKLTEVLAAKRIALSNSVSRGNPSNDVKSASNELYISIKRILQLTSTGSTAEAFCRGTLSKLITPETSVYKELYASIFDAF